MIKQIYAESGINWYFPYEVLYEDELILVLRTLPRRHRFEEARGANDHVDKWITVHERKLHSFAYIDGTTKLVEVKDAQAH